MTRYAPVSTMAELVAEPPKARSTETAFRSVTLSALQRRYAFSGTPHRPRDPRSSVIPVRLPPTPTQRSLAAA